MEEWYGEILIYQTEDGLTNINVKMQDDTVWLTQQQLVELYQSSKSNVSEHIKHIFEEGELDEESVVRKFRTTASDGKNYNVIYYNLDMIISLGYRIKSSIATKFRRWATERIKEYMIKGFTMDDERLKGNGGGNYWKELLDCIRDIRSSEKVLYDKYWTCMRQVWIMTLIVNNPFYFSRLCKINYIIRHMGIRLQR